MHFGSGLLVLSVLVMLGDPDQTYVRALATAVREDTAKVRASKAALVSADRFQKAAVLEADVANAIKWIAERSVSEVRLGRVHFSIVSMCLALLVR